MSKLEDKVQSILRKNKIKFQREKTFTDLKGGKYRYDFYIYYKGQRIIFEIQGEQHYHQITHFHKTRQSFLAAQERDRRKISYCLANGIKLYCIPYWEIEKITTFEQLINNKFLALNKWKNDEDWLKKQQS